MAVYENLKIYEKIINEEVITFVIRKDKKTITQICQLLSFIFTTEFSWHPKSVKFVAIVTDFEDDISSNDNTASVLQHTIVKAIIDGIEIFK